ncbi:MAG: orotate phosphoribosyltransferase [Chloroflexi bacterium]|nr:orotate phosphoribosyltransferase [Chloroflexota bacterium]
MLRDLGRDLVDAAYLEGEFVLSSGQKSRYYFDKYLFETKPDILQRIARCLAQLIPPGTDRLAGPELGGVPLATAVALETGLPFVIVKKEVKGYGTDHIIEGELHPGDHVVVLEDIMTTGAQGIGAARKLIEAGAAVESIIAVVDREEGAAEHIAAAGFAMSAIFRRRELGV